MGAPRRSFHYTMRLEFNVQFLVTGKSSETFRNNVKQHNKKHSEPFPATQQLLLELHTSPLPWQAPQLGSARDFVTPGGVDTL